jgi:glutamate dehydrogenase/leucine dehydrogenase
VEYVSVPDSGGFVLIDLPNAPESTGIVRWARKILKDGATSLARSMTYSYASLGMKVSGASAGISADPKVRGESVAAFGANLADAVGDRRVFLDAAKGVSEADLAPLRVLDTRHPMYFDPETHQALTNRGVLAAAAWAHGPLAGARVAIDGGGDAEVSLARAALADGATVVALGGRTLASGFDAEALEAWAGEAGGALPGEAVADGLHTGSDVAFVGAKTNSVDHDRMARVAAPVVVPYARLAVTTRALAVAARADRRVLPDFVTVAGPLPAQWPSDGATAESVATTTSDRITEVLAALPGGDDGLVLEACLAAEAFLSTWQDELPFGRPI